MNIQQSKPVEEDTIIAEARSLLYRVSFTETRGAYLKGDHVSILVDPQYNDDDWTISVLVTCYAYGHREVDWEGNVIVIAREGEETGQAETAFLDRRGQALFTSLYPGRYSLKLEKANERVMRIATVAANASAPMEERIAVMNQLSVYADQPRPVAGPALEVCLGFLCKPAFPADLRMLAAQPITREKADLISHIDLRPFAANLLQPHDATSPDNIKKGLEPVLSQAIGFILSTRSQHQEDEDAVLNAFIFRSKELSQKSVRIQGEVGPVEIRGAVRTRGAVSGRGDPRRPALKRGIIAEQAAQNPLINLALAGGKRVRDALVRLLSREQGNEDLISMLQGMESA